MKSTLLLVERDETTIMHVDLTFASSVLRFHPAASTLQLSCPGLDDMVSPVVPDLFQYTVV